MARCEQGCHRGLKGHVQEIHDAQMAVVHAQNRHAASLARLDLANVRVRLAYMRVEELRG